jgi:hypothetical protein
MNEQKTDVMSSHGLSEQERKEPDANNYIVETTENIYCTLGKIYLATDNETITHLCAECGIRCLQIIIKAKDLREEQ